MSDSPAIPATGELLSIQVGRPRDMVMQEGADLPPIPWRSGIYKAASAGPVRVSAAGIEGDGQDDLENHGGPDNVVLAYDAAHYPVWRKWLSRADLQYGNFGENFTVAGFSDDAVCIGDIWEVGPELILQITQARQPCFKLARRIGLSEIVKRVRETSWGGWYLRVLREGIAGAGMSIALARRLHPGWTAARAVQAMYNRRIDAGPARELAKLPELSTRWKQELLEM